MWRAIARYYQQAVLEKASWIGKIGSVDVLEESGAPADRTLSALLAASAIVSKYRPAIMSHLTRDVSLILVRKGHDAEYWPPTRCIAIDSELLKNRAAATVALVLVHEATHARIEASGYRHRDSRLKRIEAVCLRRQIRFMEALRPDYANVDTVINELITNAAMRRGRANWFQQNRAMIIDAIRYRRDKV